MNKELVQEEYNKLAMKLDDLQNYHAKLQAFFDKHGSVPDEHLAAWNKYQQDTRPWRQQPRTVRRLKEAAWLAAKNTQLSAQKKAKLARRAANKSVKKAKRRGVQV